MKKLLLKLKTTNCWRERSCETDNTNTDLNNFKTTQFDLDLLLVLLLVLTQEANNTLIIKDGARWRFRTSDPYRVKVMLYHWANRATVNYMPFLLDFPNYLVPIRLLSTPKSCRLLHSPSMTLPKLPPRTVLNLIGRVLPTIRPGLASAVRRSKPGLFHNSKRNKISHIYDEQEDKGNPSAWQHFLVNARFGQASSLKTAETISLVTPTMRNEKSGSITTRL